MGGERDFWSTRVFSLEYHLCIVGWCHGHYILPYQRLPSHIWITGSRNGGINQARIGLLNSLCMLMTRRLIT